MPKFADNKPEKREERLVIKLTPTERKEIAAKAEAAGLGDTIYARAIILAEPLKGQPRGVTMDTIRLAGAISEMNEVGDHLRKIVEILDAGDMPLSVTAGEVLTKLQAAVEAAMKALNVP